MKKYGRGIFPLIIVMVVTLGLAACASGSRADEEEEASHAEEAGEHAVAESAGESAEVEGGGEHARSEGGGEHAEEGKHDEEGEESGVYIGAAETWDVVRKGARLVMSFDPTSNAFVGTVENTTEQTLCAIRVEVHLSTGTELGPTARTDLPAGHRTEVRLPTGGEAFEAWTAHPEMSPCGGD